ncbi:MAG: cyclopropane-fatty-acyl-phospholipid synthase family protein [Micrococcales bacterium]|nr:cyclopropane-fatty-acyl-phospholipid synthase family protein [Micrococcales bacterium]
MEPLVRSRPRAAVARALCTVALRRAGVVAVLPDGSHLGSADPQAPRLHIDCPRDAFSRIGAHPKIGIGEAYMAGDWSAAPGTDLADALAPFASRLADLVPAPLLRLRRISDRAHPEHTRNSPEGSRENIASHYDLSNELFATFLDPTMTYSSAYFEGEPPFTGDLREAQLRKIDAALDDAGVCAGTRVLEIGTGWGALAIRAAQRGADVTSITLSSEQATLARQRAREAGVAVQVLIEDYRSVTGSFDAIISIEMIEAVGEEFWPDYFEALDRLLAPGGRVAIQAITMSHSRFLATRHSHGWIQKHIFPGGLIPSREAIDQVLARHTSLSVTHSRSLGAHYAETLRRWRHTFGAAADRVAALGFDEKFRRMWEFYLAYSEAGFRSGYLDVVQLRIERSRS